MIGYICAVIIVISIIFGFFSGNTEQIVSALLSGGLDAVSFCFKICGSICFFSGFIGIAEQAGVTTLFSTLLRPVLRFLIPSVSDDKATENAVCMNIACNVLGLGNAATPIGIKAVENMRGKNKLSVPDRSVAAFIVLNTASVTLIPTTVAAMRAAYGAPDPFSVTWSIFIVQILSCAVGIISVMLLYPKKR